jgi:heterokaryon incompatibility protein (HET)
MDRSDMYAFHLKTSTRSQILTILGIDQESLQEKNHQVPMMGKIYSQAYETFIFLEPTCPILADVIELYRNIKPHVQRRIRSLANRRNPTKTVINADEDYIWKTRESDQRYQAIARLFNNAWFTRAWVVQETVLSRRPYFIVGQNTFDLRELNEFMGYISAFGPQPSHFNGHLLGLNKGMERLRQIYNMSYMGNDREGATTNLLYLLDVISPLSEASDQRDLIYAFLGLQKGYDIRPNYLLSVEHVFITTARSIITQTHSLALLGYTERNRLQYSKINLPSWVPDWTTNHRIKPLDPLSRNHRESGFAACGDRRYQQVLQTHQNQLLVPGVVFETVTRCFGSNTVSISGIQMPDNWVEWHRFLESWSGNKSLREAGCLPYIDEQRLLSVLTAEWCMKSYRYDSTQRGTSQSSEKRYEQELFNEYSNMLRYQQGLGERMMSMKGDARDPLLPSENLSYSSLITAGRKPFKGRGDRYGLANAGTVVGDVVCILHGSNVPVVLRRLPDNCYHFIGQCYIEGGMFGEEAYWNPDETQQFCIK